MGSHPTNAQSAIGKSSEDDLGPNSGPFEPVENPDPAVHEPDPDLDLSDRKTDVLRLIAEGRTNDEIARELFIGLNPVKTYIRTAYRKIGVGSRSQAVIWAFRSGFVPLHEPVPKKQPSIRRQTRGTTLRPANERRF